MVGNREVEQLEWMIRKKYFRSPVFFSDFDFFVGFILQSTTVCVVSLVSLKINIATLAPTLAPSSSLFAILYHQPSSFFSFSFFYRYFLFTFHY